MRIIFNICLCGGVLFSGAIAAGQSVNGSVSATADAAVSSTTDSSATDSVSAAVGEGLSSVPSGASASGARRAAVRPSMLNGRNEILKLKRQNGLSLRPVLASGKTSRPGSGIANGRISNQPGSKAKLESAGGDSAGVTGAFPDSTRSTIFASPSDPGTASSLEWNPGIDFGFPDFAEEEFLKPTLKGAHSLRGESPGIKLRAKRSAGAGNAPATSLTSHTTDNSSNQPLGGSPPHTTVDQEIQSPQ